MTLGTIQSESGDMMSQSPHTGTSLARWNCTSDAHVRVCRESGEQGQDGPAKVQRPGGLAGPIGFAAALFPRNPRSFHQEFLKHIDPKVALGKI